MTYCTHCGNPVAEETAEPDVVVEAEHTESADVEIARITADRDVKIAKISAGMSDVEAAVDLAHAEGVAEGVVEALTPEPVAAAPPVVVVNDDTEGMPEPPPEAEPGDGGPSGEPHAPRHSAGANSGWFG
jgi:hypothetical protein